MYIVLAIIAFSLLIIIHELGHFMLARINNVKVKEFSIGMGPKIIGFKGKETEYLIKALPIGGYVKMHGEEEETSDERGFLSKSPLQRISIVAAGAIMNYLLAIVLLTLITVNFGYTLNTLKDVSPNSPAASAGLKAGDELLKVNGKKMYTKDDLVFQIASSKDEPINLQYKRANNIYNVNVTPTKGSDGRYIIGVTHEFIQNPNIIESIRYSFKETVALVTQTFSSLKTLVTGKANFKTDVGGPVTIVKMTGTAAKAGIWTLIWFTAFLSIQLAVFNLLPFPALDGGWVLILLIELITRRKIPDKFIGALNYFGLALLMILMFLVTVKDILFPVKF
ncbi:zinc metalloprotease [Clostridium polyendosporum]|uniref:Zinc metalloprotease n=1 Tax=Clostridium polyendosporum TaxID=69208 RepID=A0A919RYC7_9CLOT|nr:RIP metalloprotease RseP [Clostridium polyendosporum]GIM27808.1 zinc metalloprotease [Clostridium polyendosporum]